ncbi:hypothetical protein RDI58_019013 [Solanum bulbocastanum]|uniref:Uncharacterized protein n=1 Tax=Solanum bulbocastanum TaxID=147425 RepID=A0AAN8TJ32_SOLBU
MAEGSYPTYQGHPQQLETSVNGVLLFEVELWTVLFPYPSKLREKKTIDNDETIGITRTALCTSILFFSINSWA